MEWATFEAAQGLRYCVKRVGENLTVNPGI